MRKPRARRNFSVTNVSCDWLARIAHSLLECNPLMSDWKQITARIRRARTGKDPAGTIVHTFCQNTRRHGGVRTGSLLESVGNTADAGKWYLTAAERFRRADWKTKAQESATRLGATVAAEIPAPVPPRRKMSEPATENEPREAKRHCSPRRNLDRKTPVAGRRLRRSSGGASSPPQRGPGRRQRRGRRGGHDTQRASRRSGPALHASEDSPHDSGRSFSARA